MSSDRIEKAVQIFNSGFNCAQAVFAAFADDLPEGTVLKLATGFGGGIGRRGEICGAVPVIGHKHGRASRDPEAAASPNPPPGDRVRPPDGVGEG